MLTCDEALELISASLDGPLAPDEAVRLEEHLKICAPCRALRADLESLHDQLPLLNAPVPEGLSQRILDQIHAEPKVVPLPRRHGLPRHWRQWAASAAVFALVLLGAGGIGLAQITALPGESTLSSPSPTPQTERSTIGTSLPDGSGFPSVSAPVSTPPATEDTSEDLPSVYAAIPDGSASSAPPSAEPSPTSVPASTSAPAPALYGSEELDSLPAAPKSQPQADGPVQDAPAPYGAQTNSGTSDGLQETIQEVLVLLYEEELGGQAAFTRSALPEAETTALLLQPIPVTEEPAPRCAVLIYVGMTAEKELKFHLHSYESAEPLLSARDTSYLCYYVLPATETVRVETISEAQAQQEDSAVHTLCDKIDN